MDAETFWKSSPRAVYLLIKYRRGQGARQRGTASRGGLGAQSPRRVRLNYLPHP